MFIRRKFAADLDHREKCSSLPLSKPSALMGSILTQNTSAPKLNEMAQRSPADNKQHLTTQEVFEAFNRLCAEHQYSSHQVSEFGNFILQRQNVLDSEIEKYRER